MDRPSAGTTARTPAPSPVAPSSGEGRIQNPRHQFDGHGRAGARSSSRAAPACAGTTAWAPIEGSAFRHSVPAMDMNQKPAQHGPQAAIPPPSSVHPISNAATGLRRYLEISETLAAILRPYQSPSQDGWSAVAASAHAPHWVPACAGTTAWGNEARGASCPTRHSGEGRNPDRRLDMNQCALRARPARSSRLWPYHRRACINLKRRTGYRPSPVRRN